jgi:tetrahydromethanopterin S-methyltransferase subunit G
MKPDREELSRAIRRARAMADDQPLSNADIDRIDKEIREERVSEMEEAFERAFTKILNNQFQRVGKWTVNGIIAGLVLIVIAWSVAEYLKMKS